MQKTQVDARNRVWFCNNPVGFICGDTATVDECFQNAELSAFLAAREPQTQIVYRSGVLELMASGGWETEGAGSVNRVRIWQLKPESAVEKRFIAFAETLQGFGEPNMQDYQLTYDGQLPPRDLEEIYTLSNTGKLAGNKGHSLSISDVVELYGNSGSEYFYVDRFGFVMIGFCTPEQEMQMKESGGYEECRLT